jgi:antitoxin component YwqK of YwqJK toxin-antitoxin module
MSRAILTAWMPMAILIFSNCYSHNYEVVNQQYIHPYGVAIPKCQWEEAGQTGQIVKKTKQGVTCRHSFYYGNLEGETTYTFPFSDQVERKQLYSQNKLLKEMLYYPSGELRYEVAYDPVEHTLIKEWYENGSLKSYEKYTGSLLAYGEYYDSRGQRKSYVEAGNGIRTLRNTYGTLVSADAFKDGQIEHVTLYYENGIPKEVTPYINGVVHGIRKTFLAGGEPKTFETWNQGQQQGITILFINGEKAQEVPYVAGIKSGLGRVYKDGHIVVQELTWKNDKLHGPCYTYIDGRRVVDWYHRGRKVTKGYYDSFHNPRVHSLD